MTLSELSPPADAVSATRYLGCPQCGRIWCINPGSVLPWCEHRQDNALQWRPPPSGTDWTKTVPVRVYYDKPDQGQFDAEALRKSLGLVVPKAIVTLKLPASRQGAKEVWVTESPEDVAALREASAKDDPLGLVCLTRVRGMKPESFYTPALNIINIEPYS